MSEPTSSAAPPAHLVFHASSPASMLAESETALVVNFRAHPQVAQLSRLFRSIVLTSVKLTVRQLEVKASDESYTREFLRFGVTPRDIAFRDPSGNSNIVAYIPHLFDFATSSVPADVSITFGAGGISFPPGLQLDLKAAETVDLHPVAFLGNTDVRDAADATVFLASLKLDFVLCCSGEGFGSIY